MKFIITIAFVMGVANFIMLYIIMKALSKNDVLSERLEFYRKLCRKNENIARAYANYVKKLYDNGVNINEFGPYEDEDDQIIIETLYLDE